MKIEATIGKLLTTTKNYNHNKFWRCMKMMNFEQSLYVIVHIRAGIPPKQLGLVYV